MKGWLYNFNLVSTIYEHLFSKFHIKRLKFHIKSMNYNIKNIYIKLKNSIIYIFSILISIKYIINKDINIKIDDKSIVF